MEKIIVLGIIATVFISGSITPGTLVGEAAELTTSTTPAGITSKNTDEHFKHSPELSVFPDSGAAGITSKASGSGFHHLKTIKISKYYMRIHFLQKNSNVSCFREVFAFF